LNNGKFITQDIILASFLCAKGVILESIERIDSFHSQFIFEPPSQELLDYWLTSAAFERALINAYRHLIRESRNVQGRAGGGR
jgi:hypothetical protein